MNVIYLEQIVDEKRVQIIFVGQDSLSMNVVTIKLSDNVLVMDDVVVVLSHIGLHISISHAQFPVLGRVSDMVASGDTRWKRVGRDPA